MVMLIFSKISDEYHSITVKIILINTVGSNGIFQYCQRRKIEVTANNREPMYVLDSLI
jgi:hypothetical protein